MRFKLPLILAASMAVLGCDPGLPEGSNDFNAGGSAVSLSQAEFNNLPPEQQYMVANKLLGTMYRGVPMQDFFNLDAGMGSLQPNSSSFITDTRDALATNMSNEEVLVYDTIIDGLDAEVRLANLEDDAPAGGLLPDGLGRQLGCADRLYEGRAEAPEDRRA